MKITKGKLRRIIQEELQGVLSEKFRWRDLNPLADDDPAPGVVRGDDSWSAPEALPTGVAPTTGLAAAQMQADVAQGATPTGTPEGPGATGRITMDKAVPAPGNWCAPRKTEKKLTRR